MQQMLFKMLERLENMQKALSMIFIQTECVFSLSFGCLFDSVELIGTAIE